MGVSVAAVEKAADLAETAAGKGSVGSEAGWEEAAGWAAAGCTSSTRRQSRLAPAARPDSMSQFVPRL